MSKRVVNSPRVSHVGRVDISFEGTLYHVNLVGPIKKTTESGIIPATPREVVAMNYGVAQAVADTTHAVVRRSPKTK